MSERIYEERGVEELPGGQQLIEAWFDYFDETGRNTVENMNRILVNIVNIKKEIALQFYDGTLEEVNTTARRAADFVVKELNELALFTPRKFYEKN